MSSTPDALWSAPSLRLLRPAAVACTGLHRRRLLNECSITIGVGMRVLIVGEPEESASMLVRILAGLSRPSRGTVEIAGLSDASATGWGRRVAYLGPEPGIPPWMTPREALALAADLLQLSRVEAMRRTERVLSWVRLGSEWLDRPVRRGGPPMLQRTGLAAALLGDPEVLLLDEPLRAIEAAERTRLLRLPGRRRTLVLASRSPASEEGIVSHVALIRRGRVAILASVDDLTADGLGISTRGIVELAARREGPEGATDPGRLAVAPR